MKKFLILFIIINLYANDKYLEYVNKLINYNFSIDKINNITPPFEIKKFNNTKKSAPILKKRIKIVLLSVLNNKGYIKLEEYVGEKLTKTKKLWIKKGDKVSYCRVKKIIFNKVIFKCKNKTLIKSVDKKIPQLKELK